MKAYWIKSPPWLSLIFRKRIWHLSPKEKTIYLTFDDGPTKVTLFVLDQLRQHKAKATFFCIGENIDNHPSIFKQLKTDGHAIGNHTQNHKNGWFTKLEDYIENTLQVEPKILGQKKESPLKLFRPPYGKCTYLQRKLLYKKNYTIVMWSVLSADFDASISKEQCLKNVLDNTKSGSIVVFHDSKKSEQKLQYVLPKVLSHFSKKGYQFKGIDSSAL